MKTNMIVIDEFYNNPNDVREFALSQEFDVTGNWPGTRTKTFINESTKETIQKILQDVSGNVTDWQANDGYTGSFQLTTSMDRSWIHADSYNTWAGVLYLTPDAPLSGGTGIFRYKKTGSMTEDGTDLSGVTQDMTKWEMTDMLGNKFNRLVLYRADYFHTSLDYFGRNLEDGRLFQTFFFDTER